MQPNRPPPFNPAYDPTFDQSTPPPPYQSPPLPTQAVYQAVHPNQRTVMPQPWHPNVPQALPYAATGTLPYPVASQPHVNKPSVISSEHKQLPSGTLPSGYKGTAGDSSKPPPDVFAEQGSKPLLSKGNVGFVFTPSKGELSENKMSIGYCSSLDCYVHPTDPGKRKSGWRSGVYDERNIAHKVRNDWKMAFLARAPNSDSARTEWRFDLSGSGSAVKNVTVRFPASTYSTGNIRVKIVTNDETKEINHEEEGKQNFTPLHNGLQYFAIVAELDGGEGSVAWQHTLLFRQELKDSDSIFKVTIHLQGYADRGKKLQDSTKRKSF